MLRNTALLLTLLLAGCASTQIVAPRVAGSIARIDVHELPVAADLRTQHFFVRRSPNVLPYTLEVIRRDGADEHAIQIIRDAAICWPEGDETWIFIRDQFAPNEDRLFIYHYPGQGDADEGDGPPPTLTHQLHHEFDPARYSDAFFALSPGDDGQLLITEWQSGPATTRHRTATIVRVKNKLIVKFGEWLDGDPVVHEPSSIEPRAIINRSQSIDRPLRSGRR